MNVALLWAGGTEEEVSSPDPSSDGAGERGRIRHCARAPEMMKFKIPVLWLRLNLGAQPRTRLIPPRRITGPGLIVFCHWKWQCQTLPFSLLYLFVCQGESHNQKMERESEEEEVESWKWLHSSISKLHATLAFHPFSNRTRIIKKVGKLRVKRLDGYIWSHCADRLFCVCLCACGRVNVCMCVYFLCVCISTKAGDGRPTPLIFKALWEDLNNAHIHTLDCCI